MASQVGEGGLNGNGGNNEENDTYEIDHALVELCLTSTTGVGLFSTQSIQRGTRMFCEAPLVMLERDDGDPRHLWEQLEKLSPQQLSSFDSLHGSRASSDSQLAKRVQKATILSGKFKESHVALAGFVADNVKRHIIFRTNGVAIIDQSPKFAVFPLFSRMNHSCTPNVQANYNPTLKCHTVHAIRDIKEGEELVASYIDAAHPIEHRDEELAECRVDCFCDVCESSSAFAASERRRQRLAVLLGAIAAYDGTPDSTRPVSSKSVPRNSAEALKSAENAVSILKEEGLVGMWLATAYRYCSKFSVQLRDVENAKSFGMKALEVERYCLGTETDYMKDPENAESWLKHVDAMAEQERVKNSMNEKREMKEQKKADKKAARKAAKRVG